MEQLRLPSAWIAAQRDLEQGLHLARAPTIANRELEEVIPMNVHHGPSAGTSLPPAPTWLVTTHRLSRVFLCVWIVLTAFDRQVILAAPGVLTSAYVLAAASALFLVLCPGPMKPSKTRCWA